jgi:hypothetical protein
MNLPDKFIEYDVETRWNSIYRMLDDGLKAKDQINRFLSLQTEIPAFTNQEWLRLSQIHQFLTFMNLPCFYLSISLKSASPSRFIMTFMIYYMKLLSVKEALPG